MEAYYSLPPLPSKARSAAAIFLVTTPRTSGRRDYFHVMVPDRPKKCRPGNHGPVNDAYYFDQKTTDGHGKVHR